MLLPCACKADHTSYQAHIESNQLLLASANSNDRITTTTTHTLSIRALSKSLALPQALIIITHWRSAAARHASRAAAHSPLILAQAAKAAVRPVADRSHVAVHIGKIVLMDTNDTLGPDLNVVVIPSGALILLLLWQEVGTGNVENDCGDHGATDEVNSVVMREVHGSPPQPHGVEGEHWAQLWEAVRHEERLNDS